MNLRLDWCSHEAAKYAVMHWHYSQRMPMPPIVRIGAWEEGCFVGCVLFSRGATPSLGAAYGLKPIQVCELTRVALTEHQAHVSRILALAVRWLSRSNPGLRLIVSFADPDYGHHGGIYQAGNWIYTGCSSQESQFWHEGRWKHRREAVSRVTFGRVKPMLNYKQLPARIVAGKHRYLMPLDTAMRANIAPLAKPYPKRVRSTENGAEVPTSGGGVIPTRTLQP